MVEVGDEWAECAVTLAKGGDAVMTAGGVTVTIAGWTPTPAGVRFRARRDDQWEAFIGFTLRRWERMETPA